VWTTEILGFATNPKNAVVECSAAVVVPPMNEARNEDCYLVHLGDRIPY
jgi:hypothetical protein